MNRKYNHLYAIPYYLWLGLFVILPLVLVLGSSFFDIHGNFTLANYAEYFSSINYIKMTMNSFIYAGLLTIITLALSYPMAYLLSKTKHRQLWMLLVLLPTWINLLLKAYAFIGLLSQTGSVNQFLTFMGIGPKQLLFTDAAFLLVAGYIELPFMIMPIYNSTINGILARLCKKANVSTITIHGLRHTHASLLLFAGVSIASVARRLGHSSMTTTQHTYLHIIQELENQDTDIVMRHLAGLC